MDSSMKDAFPPSHDPRFRPGAEKMRQKYQGLQSLLGENSRLLEMMADLEADLGFLPLGSPFLEHRIRSLLEGTLLMIEDLDRLAEGRFAALYPVFIRMEKKILETLKGAGKKTPPRGAIPLSEVGLGQEAEVGGKAAHLGELKRILPEVVPDGFVVTAAAYRATMSQPKLAAEVRALLSTLEVSTDPERFRDKAARIRELIRQTPVPRHVQEAIRELSLPWPPSLSWAVRSSAVGEDGTLSFAGQFETILNVPPARLLEAYLKIVASHFSEKAIAYRLSGGFPQVETSMAVLFMPFIEARSAGVLYTRDPGRPEEEEMLVSATPGLAAQMVGGQAPADLFRVDRRETSRVIDSVIAMKKGKLLAGGPAQLDWEENAPQEQARPCLNREEISQLAEWGLKIEKYFGVPQDIEWAFDPSGNLRILQSRPLRLIRPGPEEDIPSGEQRPVLSGGLTIFPGRAVAPVQVVLTPDSLPLVPSGVILVAAQATPEISAVLPRLAGFISEQGHPLGHAATLLREFSIPSLFGVPEATRKLSSGMLIGLDATHRQVLEGMPWPEIRERTRARLARTREGRPSPLKDLIFSLKMTDPGGRNFKPEGCRSIHDLIRFIHEKGVAALFEAGDEETNRKGMIPRKLTPLIPLSISILDLGNALAPGAGPKGEVSPEEILSTPFQALWRGISHPRVSWAGRKEISLRGFATVVASSLSQDMGSMRRLGDPNYLLVAPEYMNLNLRLAYHYTMIDAWAGPVPENNYVNFRFRGGGGGPSHRDLRARFLAEVLSQSGFRVDRRGDLVTAWLRHYPLGPVEAGLELLGKLMGCSRQLDMLMDNESVMVHFVKLFLAGEYEAFA
jgi:pyruvate,water dikinase